MQNTATQQFISKYDDELHELTCSCYNGDMLDIVREFVQSVDANDVDVDAIALHCAIGTLHNYYDDGGEGGSIMEGFFEFVGHNGCNDLDEFEGDLRAVAEMQEFELYAMQVVAENTGVDFDAIKAHESK